MQISQLLRNRAEKFIKAADLVCVEYAITVRSRGICSPCDRLEFTRLVTIKRIAIDSESMAIVHTITGDNHVLTKLTA